MLAAVNPAAAGLGLHFGMAVAQALTIFPGLKVIDTEPHADAAGLEHLAQWCQRLTPLAAVDRPDGLWLDVTGCAHLWGGEAVMLQTLAIRLARDGLQARMAIADTPGAAHALARYGNSTPIIVPPGAHAQAIASLPVSALRIPADVAAVLRRLGFDQISHLAGVSRTLLAHRAGHLPGLRLDQMLGHVAESLMPIAPERLLERRVTFLEPLLTAESLVIATNRLLVPLCQEMERAGLGARQISLRFKRVDNQIMATRITTVRPSRDARHLAQLLNRHLDRIDPGLGIEAAHLLIHWAETLQWEQQEDGASIQDIARLVDQLSQSGKGEVYQAVPWQGGMPDRAVKHRKPVLDADQRAWMQLPDQDSSFDGNSSIDTMVATTAAKPSLSLVTSNSNNTINCMTPTWSPSIYIVADDHTMSLDQEPPILAWKARSRKQAAEDSSVPWPRRLHAPSRLVAPPYAIKAIAGLPNQPPSVFTWRGCRYYIRRANGPERIHDRWWQHGHLSRSVRDYYLVEDKYGQRFWLFRLGDGRNLLTGNLSWFLHGLF